MIILEAFVYAVQIASFFLLAGPALLRAERQRTLARNPAWVAEHPEFHARYGRAEVRASHLFAIILLLLLGAAAAMGSRPLMFLVHAPVFLVLALGLIIPADRRERKLRAGIPEEAVRRASLRPRTVAGLLPPGMMAALGLLAAGSLAVNAWGWLSGSMLPARAAGNAAFFGLFAVGMGLVMRYIAGRPSFRFSESTEATGRSLEMSLTLGVSLLLAVVNLFHSLGSLGADPLFPYPPSMIHALIESQPWSWSLFLARPEYRWAEMAAALAIAWVGPWLAVSPFHRRLLTVDVRTVRSASEV